MQKGEGPGFRRKLSKLEFCSIRKWEIVVKGFFMSWFVLIAMFQVGLFGVGG